VKRLLKHTAAAILLAVAATMLIATPASAARLSTSIETTSSVYDCPSTTDCFRHGNAPQGTLARSYCFINEFDLVFSEGVANRFGFIAFTALVDKTQNTGCFNGGTQTSVDGDTPLRACANQNCLELSDLALADSLRAYCTRNDSTGTVWIGIFNTNGQHTGFTRRADLNLTPSQSFPAC
jgi:hypothetical protein